MAVCGPRSATSISIGWYNVKEQVPAGAQKDKCCTGDGLTDDTLVLQAWIDYATGAVDNPVIYLPPGYYKITSPITITKPCVIMGLGNIAGSATQNGTQLVVSPATGANLFDALQVTGVLPLAGNNVLIEGLTIIGPSSGVLASTTQGYGVNVTGSQFVQIRNIRIVNMSMGVNVDASGAVLCENVVFIPFDAATTPGSRVGFRATWLAAGNGNECILIACGVDESGNTNHVTTAFSIEDKYNTLILSQCYANSTYIGYRSTKTTARAPNIFQVLECTSTNCTFGVSLEYGEVTIIDSCAFTKTVFRNGAGGIAVNIAPTFTSGPILMSNCVVDTTDYAGVFVNDGGSNISIAGGNIANTGRSGTASAGLRIQQQALASTLSVTGLTIDATTKAGVYISSGHVGTATLSGIMQTSGGQYGLLVDAGVTGIYNVSGCSFSPASSFTGSSTDTVASRLADNVGINPVGPLTVSGPGSGYTLNNFGVDVSVYIDSSVTPTLKDPAGATTPLLSLSGLVRLPAGWSISLNPFAGVGWKWFGD
jgi:hypothetical protein